MLLSSPTIFVYFLFVMEQAKKKAESWLENDFGDFVPVKTADKRIKKPPGKRKGIDVASNSEAYSLPWAQAFEPKSEVPFLKHALILLLG